MAENLPARPPQKLAPSGPAPVPEPPPPPSHLGEDSSRHWEDTVAGWHLAADGLPILRKACEVHDVYDIARKRVVAEGPVVKHPTTGALVTHPAYQVMRDSLKEWRQLWRMLGLQPPETP